MLGDGEAAVNAVENKEAPPPPVINAPPERDLEHKLKLKPDDPDAKADVGSDQSMDASDPSSATQPGGNDHPAPSSGFPQNSEGK
jgi:hypothetical protein